MERFSEVFVHQPAELALRLMFFAAVLFGGLLLLYLTRRLVSLIGEGFEAVWARFDERGARRRARGRVDKLYAEGKIGRDEYRDLRRSAGKRKR